MACKTVIRANGKVVKTFRGSATMATIAAETKRLMRAGKRPSVKYECSGKDAGKGFTLMGVRRRRKRRK